MPKLLVATDADWVADELSAAVEDDRTEVSRVRSGAEVLPAVRARQPDLVVLDLQIGNMGGFATCRHLRNEEGAGRISARPILMLLDRSADVFLARRAEADGWLVKPLDAVRIRRAVTAMLGGESYREGSESLVRT